MENFKGLFESKTVWGGILAVVGAVAGLFGYTVAPEDMAGAVEAVGGVVAAIGGLYAIYGRVRASKQIG